MVLREDLELISFTLALLGFILCGFTVGYFFGAGFGFLFVGLPLLCLGIYGLIRYSK